MIFCNRLHKFSQIVTIAIFIITPAFSQQFYFSASGSYGFPAAPILTSYESTWDTSSQTYKKINGGGSLGKGYLPSVNAGYFITERFTAELNVNYLFGAKISSKQTINLPSSKSEQVTDFSANMLRLIPSLKILTGTGKEKFYMKNGLVIGLIPKVKEISQIKNTNQQGTSVIDKEREYSGNVSFGYMGVLGFNYQYSEKLGFFIEGTFIMQSWSPNRSIYTKWTSWTSKNGVDELPSKTVYEKEMEYSEEFTNTINNLDTGMPKQSFIFYFPFSSAGISLGLSYVIK